MPGVSRPVVLDEQAVNVFTDGSSYGSPRRGGVGYLIVVANTDTGEEETLPLQPYGFREGTNQQMELMACIEALRDLGGRHPSVDVRQYKKVVIHTDSMYVSENYYAAQFVWPASGWMTRDGNPVVNARLWKDLVAAARKVPRRVEFEWHKGHKGNNPHNRTADKLAKGSATGALREPVSVSRVGRKTTSKVTEQGSIRPEGQRIRLRIVTDEYLPLQKMYRYRCEVMSRRSPYFGNLDWLYSDLLLNARHTYDVRLNDDPARPRIAKCFREVTT